MPSATAKNAKPNLLFIHERAAALPLVMAVMGFLATLALIGGFALNKLATEWANGLSGTLTVEISVEAQEAYKAETGNALTPVIVSMLEAHNDIGAAIPIEQDAMAVLLAPWFPDPETVSALPLPQLIDVKLVGTKTIDIDALNSDLAAIHDEVRADDYQRHIADQVSLARKLGWLGFSLIILVTFATAMIIGFATRASFDAHRPTVDLMHLIGTPDRRVINMFGRHFMLNTLSGSIFGMGIGMLIIVLLARNSAIGVTGLWAGIGPAGLVIGLFMPFLMGLLALFMARREVRSQLAQMI